MRNRIAAWAAAAIFMIVLSCDTTPDNIAQLQEEGWVEPEKRLIYPDQVEQWRDLVAEVWKVPPYSLAAENVLTTIWCESAGDPGAYRVNPDGRVMGLLQIHEGWFNGDEADGVLWGAVDLWVTGHEEPAELLYQPAANLVAARVIQEHYVAEGGPRERWSQWDKFCRPLVGRLGEY